MGLDHELITAANAVQGVPRAGAGPLSQEPVSANRPVIGSQG